ADVAKYLKDVTPPDLVISTRPRDGTLAGLPTWFAAHAPSRLRPTPFGSGQITETITIHPMRSKWQFGDGTAVTRTATATARHTYLRGGHRRGRLTTRWGATYTISYAGGSYGPYHATGTLVRRQRFSMPVHTSRPVLVSH
ncbi:MAG TPA: hypothetical protein VG708_06260, partial [Mycobacteriales bacterium]|nr:hypothetical protein [Mycobacteriales bacterium]